MEKNDRDCEYQWLTTIRYRSRAKHCGKLHIVVDQRDARCKPALCGLRPKHGWILDIFNEDKCMDCLAKLRSQSWHID